MLENFEQLTYPSILALGLPLVLLVLPVSGDAQFRNFVHFARADLNLDSLLFGANQRRMKGPVAVPLRRRHVVLEAARYH